MGIDRFGSGHQATSSTGPSRSFRIAYDQPFYVDLAREALEGWRRLERDVDERVLLLTGQIDFGPTTKLDALAAGMAACDAPLERLDPADVAIRFPELRTRPDEQALFHADAGTALADVAMRALRSDAEGAGALLSEPETAIRVEVTDSDAVVATDRGRTIRAATVIASAGPWLGALLADGGLDLPLAPAVAQVSFVALPPLDERPGIADWQIDDQGSASTGTRCRASGTRSRSTQARPIHGIPMPRGGPRPRRGRGASRDGCRPACRSRLRTSTGISGIRGR